MARPNLASQFTSVAPPQGSPPPLSEDLILLASQFFHYRKEYGFSSDILPIERTIQYIVHSYRSPEEPSSGLALRSGCARSQVSANYPFRWKSDSAALRRVVLNFSDRTRSFRETPQLLHVKTGNRCQIPKLADKAICIYLGKEWPVAVANLHGVRNRIGRNSR